MTVGDASMHDLAPYARAFDTEYPDYADARYAEITSLIDSYGSSEDLLSIIAGKPFELLTELIRPITAVKNYKSQTPFPEDIRPVVANVIELKRCDIGEGTLAQKTGELFRALIKAQGFQLPTVSAVFHFCHPNAFPIVGRNVE